MSKTQIPVACVQTRAHDRERFGERLPEILALTDRACRAGAKLVVLPEGSVPAYVLGDRPVDDSELADAGNAIAKIAREHNATIVYGGAKRLADRTFNAAIAVGPTGEELGFAAKQFLWHFDRRWFAAGATLDPIETPLGKLGLLVCADARIPTIAATLVDRGARILVMPTAWVTSGRDPAALENVQADLMANVRARENGVPFVVANKCGVERESVAYCGKSAIIDATGAFVARGTERDEAIVAGTIATDDALVERTRVLEAHVRERPDPARSRARIAFAFAGRDDAARFAQLAAQADADTFVTFARARDRATDHAGEAGGLIRIALDATSERDVVREVAGLRYAFVGQETLANPRGLAPARLAGVDLFICALAGDADWNARVVRTRAVELRAFALVFDTERERAFAVDPDGVIVAGTFDDYRLAAFVYDAARAAQTIVAPRTDVLEGLRIAESIRATPGARAKVTV